MIREEMFTELHPFNFKAVCWRKHAVKQFRAELVKAMAKIIVCRRLNEKRPPDFKRFHQVPNGKGEIKNMLQRSRFENGIVTIPQMARKRRVHVEHMSCR